MMVIKMKHSGKLFTIIFFMLFAYSHGFCQEKPKAPEVQKYEDYLDSLAERPNAPSSGLEVSDKLAKHFARMIFEAQEKDTKELFSHNNRRSLERNGTTKERPAILVGMMQRKYENLVTNNQKTLFFYSFLLEVTINSAKRNGFEILSEIKSK